MEREIYKENRPWGYFERFTLNELSTVKLISVNSGEALSLQTHSDREEFWRVISGSGIVTIGNEQFSIIGGKEFWVPRGTPHRIEAQNEKVFILEISFGLFREDDIVRLEDKYKR